MNIKQLFSVFAIVGLFGTSCLAPTLAERPFAVDTIWIRGLKKFSTIQDYCNDGAANSSRNLGKNVTLESITYHTGKEPGSASNLPHHICTFNVPNFSRNTVDVVPSVIKAPCPVGYTYSGGDSGFCLDNRFKQVDINGVSLGDNAAAEAFVVSDNAKQTEYQINRFDSLNDIIIVRGTNYTVQKRDSSNGIVINIGSKTQMNIFPAAVGTVRIYKQN